MTLRAHLVLLTLATLLPVAVFAIVVGLLLIESDRETFRYGTQERARAILTALDVELGGSISTLEALAVSPTLNEGDLGAFRALASSVLYTQPDWSTINLALPSGQQIMNLNVSESAPLPMIPAVDDSIARIRETRGAVIGDLIVGPTTGIWDFAVRVPIVTDGKVRHILSAVVKPDSIHALLAAQGLPKDWVGVVLDRHDRIVARTLNSESVGQLASPTLRRSLAVADSGWSRIKSIEGSDVYTAHHRSATSGWAFALFVPAHVVEQTGQRAGSILAVGLTVALGLALALALLVGRRISRPISSLAAATKALGRGDPLALQQDMNVDEVRTLARALQEAADAIRERQNLIEREKEALQAADRTKDEFLAMLSHELRTPLAALTTAAHVLRVARPDDERAAQACGVLERQTRHMARLVEDLLDVSRVTLGKVMLQREPLDLAEVVENIVAAWRQSRRFERHHLVCRTAPAWIDADRTRIDQIVSNLLDNALKFTPPGRKIEVTVRRSGGEALLQVADEGEGLAPEALKPIFDLFAQGPQGLDRRRGGMGIGLALVKRLTEMHGGTVSVESPGPGRGAVFTVRLPAAMRPHSGAERARAEKHASARRILIIEDNDDTRQMLRAALTLHGHEVQEACDGTTGLALAAAAPPDVALIDLGLPDIDGYEVARRLHANRSNGRIPLIALSGYGRPADLQRAFEAGFSSHLTKPVAIEQLRSAITALQ